MVGETLLDDANLSRLLTYLIAANAQIFPMGNFISAKID